MAQLWQWPIKVRWKNSRNFPKIMKTCPISNITKKSKERNNMIIEIIKKNAQWAPQAREYNSKDRCWPWRWVVYCYPEFSIWFNPPTNNSPMPLLQNCVLFAGCPIKQVMLLLFEYIGISFQIWCQWQDRYMKNACLGELFFILLMEISFMYMGDST